MPIGALYTPLKPKPDTPLLQFEPVVCKQPCRSVLNPYWQVYYPTTPILEANVNQPGRHASSSLDLSFLSFPQSSTATLQGHFSKCHSTRASSFEYHNRIQAFAARTKCANLSVCRGYMSRRGQLKCSEGVTCYELELAPRKCSCGISHVWHNGRSF